jgi:hypothetical protein
MPAKINVFNLGSVGVDIVSSPLHSADGSFVSAQNAESSPTDQDESIQKRGGITRLSSGSMGSSVVMIHNILAGTV